MTHFHQLHTFHVSFVPCKGSMCVFLLECISLRPELTENSAWSQDTEKRLFLHKLVHCLTTLCPGESISFIVKMQFNYYFESKICYRDPINKVEAYCGWVIQEVLGQKDKEAWPIYIYIYISFRVMTTPMDSSCTVPTKALNSSWEMSFWIFKPLSRQIYTMNQSVIKTAEHISVSSWGNKGEKKVYMTNVHISVT